MVKLCVITLKIGPLATINKAQGKGMGKRITLNTHFTAFK